MHALRGLLHPCHEIPLDADEVRSLAQRTAASIIEINQIIQTVQTGAVDAAQAIESGQARSEESVEQVT